MCQPGRPGPHGDGQAGSPGLDDFQSAKSAAERLPVVDVKEPVSPAERRRVSWGGLERTAGQRGDAPSPSSSSSLLPLLHGCSLA